MKWIHRVVLGFVSALALQSLAWSAGSEGMKWQKAEVSTNDTASLQRGAKLFVNYCLNCHSAAFMRYNRLTEIGLTEAQIKENLLFGSAKIGETMVSAINPAEAKKWFGANPPDLTLVARSRAGSGGSGADYLYTFLRSFYRDDTRPTGWNNALFPNVGMPHALWERQGEREPVFRQEGEHKVLSGWKQTKPGTSPNYDRDVTDLVNFMVWMAEPAQNARVRTGVGVILFLMVLSIFFWRLNKAYWKEVR